MNIEKETLGIIYITRCLTNQKVYVGLHTRGRKDYLGSGKILKVAMKKYGRANFERTDLDVFLTLEEGHIKERRWIAALNSKVPNGYNLADGGQGASGYSHTATARAKMSAAKIGNTYARDNKGWRQSESTKNKISVAHKGKRMSEETRVKISVALTGKHLSKEHCANISAGHAGKHPTDLSRAKMSAAHKGVPLSDEHKARMRGKRNYYPIVSEETRKKLSISHKGKSLSEETRKKISLALMKYYKNKIKA